MEFFSWHMAWLGEFIETCLNNNGLNDFGYSDLQRVVNINKQKIADKMKLENALVRILSILGQLYLR